MSFQEELEKTLDAALQEKRQEDEATQAFERESLRLRQDRVLPLFSEAVRAFCHKLQAGDAELFNGGSIRLIAKWKRLEYSLVFEPDAAQRVVVCSSSFDDEPGEPFTLDSLTESAIQHKIEAFAFRVVTGRQRSVYESRGVLSF